MIFLFVLCLCVSSSCVYVLQETSLDKTQEIEDVAISWRTETGELDTINRKLVSGLGCLLVKKYGIWNLYRFISGPSCPLASPDHFQRKPMWLSGSLYCISRSFSDQANVVVWLFVLNLRRRECSFSCRIGITFSCWEWTAVPGLECFLKQTLWLHKIIWCEWKRLVIRLTNF